MERGTNVRFGSEPFLHGGNLSLKSTSVVFSSVYLGHCSSVFLGHCSSVFLRQCSFVFLEHCSSVFLRHGSGVLLRHSRRSNCISIDPFLHTSVYLPVEQSADNTELQCRPTNYPISLTCDIRSSFLLKCVVSIWVLPVRRGG